MALLVRVIFMICLENFDFPQDITGTTDSTVTRATAGEELRINLISYTALQFSVLSTGRIPVSSVEDQAGVGA